MSPILEARNTQPGECMQANGPAAGGFNRAFVDDFLGGMVCRWPGVRHALVSDAPQAAEHIAGLTRALAEQPFRAEVSSLPYRNSNVGGSVDVAKAEYCDIAGSVCQ